VDTFRVLDRDWQAEVVGQHARRAIGNWATRISELAGFDTPAELLADIGRMGDPERSCRLLAHLLVLAGDDPIAARAVLQAVTPGLRTVTARRWRTASGNGPWSSYEDIAADAISAAWEAIRSSAGERHTRPARVVVRFAEGRLRRAHDRWREEHHVATVLAPDSEPTLTARDALSDTEHQAVRLITDALGEGVIDPKQASILTATAVHGHTVVEAESALGWTPKSGYRALEQARRRLREWLDEGPPEASRTPSQTPPRPKRCLTVELPSHSMNPLVSAELCALLAKLIRRRADLTRPGAAA
jgi:DNA-directed RNA polymerase specialized sigma24 family protein